MQLSLNWLKDFINIPKIITPEELGLKLTMHTVEIDGIKKQGLDNVIFEVDNKSIANRPDLWGHYGMAREIAAFLETQMKTNFTQINTNDIKINKPAVKLKVEVEDSKLCPRYMAVAIDEIKIQESPEWMQKKLLSVGMSSINNIVDITNYVMIELGQPTHIFDASRIKYEFNANYNEFKIIIRRAKKGEIIKTLDNKERELDENMLVIADLEKPIALAGIMGGVNSEVDNNTTAIIIESANFEPISIRKTAQKLGLRTEASMRFEKSLDPNLCETALIRVVELIQQICPKAKIISNLVDKKNFDLKNKQIEIDLEWINKRIGQKIPEKKIIKILESLGFGINKDTECPIGHSVSTTISVIIPSWRAKDISIPEDIVEEVARIYGYDNLQPVMPKVEMKTPEINQEKMLERKIKNILSLGAGLTETHNYSFVSKEQLKKLNIDASFYVKLANPISSHHALLTQSLIPNLLNNIKINQVEYDQFGLFEIGGVYFNAQGEFKKSDKTNEKLLHQENKLGIILAGNNQKETFNKIKGIIEYLSNYLDLQVEFGLMENHPEWANKQGGAKINVVVCQKNVEIGFIYILNQNSSKRLGIKKYVATAEISLKELFNIISHSNEKKYKEIFKYPIVVRDLAFVIDNKVLYSNIKKEIENFSKLIVQVELFDVYYGEKLGIDKKNLGFHIEYQSPNKTLVANEVNEMQKNLIKYLENKFQAQIRNF